MSNITMHGIRLGFDTGVEAKMFPVTLGVLHSEIAAIADLLRKHPGDRACCRVIARTTVTDDGVSELPGLVYDPRRVIYAAGYSVDIEIEEDDDE